MVGCVNCDIHLAHTWMRVEYLHIAYTPESTMIFLAAVLQNRARIGWSDCRTII